MKFLKHFVHNFIRKGIRNTKYRWLIVVASLAYLISPLDISPDVFPVLGLLDDGILVSLIATEMSQFLLERRQAKKDESAESVVSS
jgi:uncharacterized membrane protein YkvA (DUF1232 family)